MTANIKRVDFQFKLASFSEVKNRIYRSMAKQSFRAKIARQLLLLSGAVVLVSMSVTTSAQTQIDYPDSISTTNNTHTRQLDLTYTPPEWEQGVEGYGKRYGSNYAIAAVATTTRYGLAEAFKEDTMYYRCECSGVLPRLRHAVISTVTARRGMSGHEVFSVPAIVAPYAGSMTAIYGWYPNRYGAKDAFRMGNYSLLAYAGGNIALEFISSGSHSLLKRMHLHNAHGAPAEGQNQ
jgi:hypothetical protein